ncbi:MAG TPA: methyltransferase domain-containing protein [Caldithrix abyssi]|uniref:Methyltransferase domain-containing protein n=1 Tax=Caldithrix abyssi TaxID=187145 RepID=A0A7V4WTU4_CALAY|nr:methyltransferase domain-containing protein [Caldithrix abyssi]
MIKYEILPRSFSVRTTTAHYAAVAWFYNLWAYLTENKAIKRALALSEIEDGMDILEVAVGTGRLFAQIVQQNPKGRNEGVDISPDMISYAQKRLTKVSPVSYKLQQASAYRLPFEDNSFDRVFNTYMLDLLPEKDFSKILEEFRRVLKPAGRLILITFGFGEFRINRFWYWLAKNFPALLTNCRPVRVDSYMDSAGLRIQHSESISQNTFPSDITVAIPSV